MSATLLGVAIAFALLAALLGALRPTVLAALLSGQPWAESLDVVWIPYLNKVSNIYLLLALELLEGAALIVQGMLLSYFAARLGERWRSDLTKATLRALAGHADPYLGRYVGLSKTYVDAVELFYRHNLVQTLAGGVQLLLALLLALAMNAAVAGLLLAEILLLLALTTVYGGLHGRLALRHMQASEILLANAMLSPRKGISIWYGGLGATWLSRRLEESNALARMRVAVWFGETMYFNMTTIAPALLVVAGYAILVGLGYGSIQDFTALLLFAGFMMGPITRVSSVIPEYRSYSVARNELRGALQIAPKPQTFLEPDTLTFSGDRIESGRVQSRAHFDIGVGDRVAIVGASGTGKTSSALSLLGASRTGVTNACISGHPASAARFSLPDLGVRYLSDTPVFEAGTLLAYCQATTQKCWQIIVRFKIFEGVNASEIEQFLRRSVLASGEPLSLGERQRVQLLRAMLEKPRVLFLDEALSGIEESAEREIVSRLILDASISTIVYIGHRTAIQGLFTKRIELRA